MNFESISKFVPIVIWIFHTFHDDPLEKSEEFDQTNKKREIWDYLQG